MINTSITMLYGLGPRNGVLNMFWHFFPASTPFHGAISTRMWMNKAACQWASSSNGGAGIRRPAATSSPSALFWKPGCVAFDAAKWIDVFLGSEVANGFRSILFEPKLKDSNVISIRIFMSKLVEFTSFVPRIHEVKIMFKTDSWELLSQLSLMWLALVHFRNQICSWGQC